MEFLKNAWYVAAWADELGEATLVGRTILERPVLLFRQRDGTAKAIGNRCPHRFAPLSMGRHVGDSVQCGYHGLEFNGTGACSHNPFGGSEGRYPAKVPSYPLVERHAALWIWMGDDAPDETLIPDSLSFMTDPSRREAHGLFEVAANYALLNDNLMDLSHGIFLHQGALSTTEMLKNYNPKVSQEGDRILSQRQSPGIVPPSLWTPGLAPGVERVDFFSHLEWNRASNVVLEVGCTPLGQPFRSPGELTGLNANLFTPETRTSTHYFWAFSRNFALDNEDVDRHVRATTNHAFVNEDKPMLEAQQRMIGDTELMSLQPVLLRTDNAAVRVRRLLQRMIDAERARAAPPAEADARELQPAEA